MYPDAIFNRYDLRGAYPDEINEDVAEKLGLGIAAFLDHTGSIVIGHDTRPHSRKIGDALVEGVTRGGVNTIRAGLSPTDKVSVCTAAWDADLGVMATASHHAWQRTGCKLLYRKGHGFSNEDMDQVKDLYNTTPPRDIEPGAVEEKEDAANTLYTDHAVATVQNLLGTASFDTTIVVDCCTGAASILLPHVLRELGCTVHQRNAATEPDEGIDPEPGEENRAYLREAVKTTAADLAVGVDPDADRIYAFDKHGAWVSGQELFAVLAAVVDADIIAASLDTSQLLHAHTGASIHETRVGDVFVAEEAVNIGADMYGEPNGHFAFPTFSWYPSGTFAALLLAGIADTLPEQVQNLPAYATVRHTVPCQSNEGKHRIIEAVTQYVTDNYKVLSTVDGVKFAVNGGTVLIRPSGTSPKIRCIFEHENQEEAEWMKEIVLNALTQHTPLQ